jgi:hypothetical protein
LRQPHFEWDETKNRANQDKHGLAFETAQYAFADSKRVIAADATHSGSEQRFCCFGKVGNEIVTVRFTMHQEKIRIIGAGYWRKGKRIYEKKNSL